MKELIQQVQEWANERCLNKPDQAYNQLLKVCSEFGETCDAILHREKNGDKDLIDGLGDIIVTLVVICNMKDVGFTQEATDNKFKDTSDIYFADYLHELVDLLTAVKYLSDESFSLAVERAYFELCCYVRYYGFTPEQCLKAAYNEIKDRKGVTVNGTFIKDEAQIVAETKSEVDLSQLEIGDAVVFAIAAFQFVRGLEGLFSWG